MPRLSRRNPLSPRRRRPGAPGLVAVAVVVALAGALTACGSASGGVDSGSGHPSLHPLPTGTKFDYQLGGSYAVPSGVGIVARDSTSKPASGVYSICYINGFQTQPDDSARWKREHSDLVLHQESGAPLIDPDWPDELIVDSSTAAKRQQIASLVGRTIALCARKGFDAVEFDNLDSWTRSKGMLTRDDNLALAKLLVGHAHRLGMTAGQKNTVELGTIGRDRVGFDFAIAEECYRYRECAGYIKAYGARVLEIEYTDDQRGSFAATCEHAKAGDRQASGMTILRDRDLVTPASKKYVYRSC